MRCARCWLVAGALSVTAAALAQDDEAPDLAFLEYLGSWEESDDEWLVVAEEILAPAADEVAPAVEAEQVEQDDDQDSE